MLVKTFDLISKCGDTFKHYGYVDQRKESGVHIKYINVIKGMYKGANQQSEISSRRYTGGSDNREFTPGISIEPILVYPSYE